MGNLKIGSFFNIYLAALGLSCSMWDLAARRLSTGLVTLRHVGSQVPDQVLNLCPLHCIADS